MFLLFLGGQQGCSFLSMSCEHTHILIVTVLSNLELD